MASCCERLDLSSDGVVVLFFSRRSRHTACALVTGVQTCARPIYLEIARCGRVGDDDWVDAAVALSRHEQIPLVATNDVRFLAQDDFETHEARVCIAQGRVLNDPKRPRDYSDQQYLKSSEEMAELFADLPEALENSVEIARRCSLTLTFAPPYHLPNLPVPEAYPTSSWLRKSAREGLLESSSEARPVGK